MNYNRGGVETNSPLENLLIEIRAVNEESVDSLKVRPKSFFVDLSETIDTIIETINKEFGTDYDRNTLKTFYDKLKAVKDVYAKKNPIEAKRINDLKLVGKKEYYDDPSPSMLLVVDRILNKLEKNWKYFSVSKY